MSYNFLTLLGMEITKETALKHTPAATKPCSHELSKTAAAESIQAYYGSPLGCNTAHKLNARENSRACLLDSILDLCTIRIVIDCSGPHLSNYIIHRHLSSGATKAS
jgi:hypothetical protein